MRGDCTVVGHVFGDSGPPVVILHGLAGSATEFVPTARELSADHRVLVVDQRGHGCSTQRPEDLSRRAFVDDVIAQIEAFADEPVTLVGQSMGGDTAMRVAHARPDLVRHLVMVEAHPDGDDGGMSAQALEDYFRSWPALFPDRGQATIAMGDSPLARAWAADLEPVDGGFAPRFEASVMRRVIEPVHRCALRAWGELTVPVTVILGERGDLSAARRQRLAKTRPSARFLSVPAAGHDPHLDNPAGWIASLRAAVS